MEATSSVFAPVACYGRSSAYHSSSRSGGRRWGLSISRGFQRSGICASHVKKRHNSLGLAGHGRGTKCNAAESDAESSEGAAKVAVSSSSDDERRNPKEEDNASSPTPKDSLTDSYLTESGFWQGVLEEITLIEWPSFQKVVGRTGVVVAIIVGSSLVLLTVNAILAELADKIINNPAISGWF